MRASEFLIEGQIGRLIVGPPNNQQLIVVGNHAMDQTIDRMVLPSDVDRVLKKLHTVSDKISQIETGHKFWVYDPELDVALGFRSVQPGVKYKLNTVVGDRPYDGVTPVVVVNETILSEASARKVLQYIKRTHGQGFDIDRSVLTHKNWELKSVPVSTLKLDTEEPDPYGRVNWIDPGRLADTDIDYIRQYPIVVDSNGWIIDGNHRATKARDLGLRTIQAWVPAN